MILKILQRIGEYWKGILTVFGIVGAIATVTLKIDNRIRTVNEPVLVEIKKLNDKVEVSNRQALDGFGEVKLRLEGVEGRQLTQAKQDSIQFNLLVKHVKETLKEEDFLRWWYNNDLKKKNNMSWTVPMQLDE